MKNREVHGNQNNIEENKKRAFERNWGKIQTNESFLTWCRENVWTIHWLTRKKQAEEQKENKNNNKWK